MASAVNNFARKATVSILLIQLRSAIFSELQRLECVHAAFLMEPGMNAALEEKAVALLRPAPAIATRRWSLSLSTALSCEAPSRSASSPRSTKFMRPCAKVPQGHEIPALDEEDGEANDDYAVVLRLLKNDPVRVNLRT